METDWKQVYDSKIITAAQAASMLRNGDAFCSGAKEAKSILREIGKREDLQHVLYYGPEANFPDLLDNMGKGLSVCTSFRDGINGNYVTDGTMEFIPCGFSGFSKVALKSLNCRAVFTCVSKPDQNGYVSFGTSADMMPTVCRKAELAVAEINEYIPFVMGDNVMHISEFDYIVEGEGYPMSTRQIDDAEENRSVYQAIGGYLSELIENEATLEVGIGRLNSSAMMYLEGVRDLGIHTEIYGDLLMELTKKGIVTNRKKKTNQGISLCTQVVGSAELIKYAENNSEIHMDCCDHVLMPGVIAANNKMTAINNAVQIDLLGQGNAEYLKGKQHSGMGGIGDFATGAVNCPDGKSIIVIDSVTKNGKYSKIVPYFAPGTPVSLTRLMIEYVVTEYGIAVLTGRSVKERAKELIGVAHPKFRDELKFEAEKIGLM